LYGYLTVGFGKISEGGLDFARPLSHSTALV
jgi:hypothetical protein